MSTTLPEKASLDQLRKQAKEMRKSGDAPSLAAAQFALAQNYGYASWPKLVFDVQQQALRSAIRDGENEAMAKLLKESPRLSKAAYPDGSTPLHQAAEMNDPAQVEILVKAGAPFKSRYNTSSHTALSWAVTCWATEAALKLVELGDRPDLFTAAGLGLLDHVESYWSNGKLEKNPSQTGSTRWNEAGERLPSPPTSAKDLVSDALYIACRNGRKEVAEWLLDHGADPNWRGFIGAPCLSWAEFSEDQALCDLLRERGARDDMIDFEFGAVPRVFPVMVLAGWGFRDKLANRLAAEPDLLNATARCGTALHAAAKGGFADAARILLAAGIDRSALDPEGRTAAEVADQNGHPDLAALLKQA